MKEDGKAPWDRIELGTVQNTRTGSIENEDEKKEPGPETCAPGPDGKQTGEEKVQLASDRQTSRSGCRIEADIFILPLSVLPPPSAIRGSGDYPNQNNDYFCSERM
jgi:hypothetical protein